MTASPKELEASGQPKVEATLMQPFVRVLRNFFACLTTLLFAYLGPLAYFQPDLKIRYMSPFILVLKLGLIYGWFSIYPLMALQGYLQVLERQAAGTSDLAPSGTSAWWELSDAQTVLKGAYLAFICTYIVYSGWYIWIRPTQDDRLVLFETTAMISIFPMGVFFILPLQYLRWCAPK